MGTAIEMEFAIDLDKKEFYFLQVRPVTVRLADVNINKSEVTKEDVFLFSDKAIGNDVYDNLTDIIFVNLENFVTTTTEEIAIELDKLNEKFSKTNKKYVLIGPGRWGSRDRFLGIPVTWRNINNVKIIVEQGIEILNPEASQGTHFFHNIVSLGIGYFSIPYKSDGWVDYEWLNKQEVVEKTRYFTHVQLKSPLKVLVDGKKKK